ncbi:hypothetical protein A9F13_28g00374 [Clavispora lusitaniae]|uniref:DUF202 domain-containing protein n=1 Tax=Clavispora lusitaniae TaxID=36911 RepID=A0AA91PUZ9_CLALS|nr:hypothetical protein A9F13_28g00374 [Clavispora lusitaniae]
MDPERTQRLHNPFSDAITEDDESRSIPSDSSISSFEQVRSISPEPFDPVDEPAISQPRWFPRFHILPVSSSEPRDVLQSERTLLSFVRFATSLNFTAIGMILNFRLDTSSGDGDSGSGHFDDTTFNSVVSFILVVLAFGTLIVSGWNYFRTVRKYSQKRIHTRSTNNMSMVVCVSAAVMTLIGINISLVVERLTQRK